MLAGLKVTRLFAFGYSFTAYHYPTWADIAGTAFDTFENWGKPSSGNNYILNSLIECTLTNQLNSKLNKWIKVCLNIKNIILQVHVHGGDFNDQRKY
jgi:hypothetical protein